MGAVSARPGVIWYSDVAAQVGDAELVVVRALTAGGLPITMEVQFAKLWGGASGWRGALACPMCELPARFLAVTDTWSSPDTVDSRSMQLVG